MPELLLSTLQQSILFLSAILWESWACWWGTPTNFSPLFHWSRKLLWLKYHCFTHRLWDQLNHPWPDVATSFQPEKLCLYLNDSKTGTNPNTGFYFIAPFHPLRWGQPTRRSDIALLGDAFPSNSLYNAFSSVVSECSKLIRSQDSYPHFL